MLFNREEIQRFQKDLSVKTQIEYDEGLYTGQLIDMLRNGKGIFEMKNGTIYLGYF